MKTKTVWKVINCALTHLLARTIYRHRTLVRTRDGILGWTDWAPGDGWREVQVELLSGPAISCSRTIHAMDLIVLRVPRKEVQP